MTTFNATLCRFLFVLFLLKQRYMPTIAANVHMVCTRAGVVTTKTNL